MFHSIIKMILLIGTGALAISLVAFQGYSIFEVVPILLAGIIPVIVFNYFNRDKQAPTEEVTKISRDEAYKAMLEGNKVAHEAFTEGEYLYIDTEGTIRDEYGYNFDRGWERRNQTIDAIDWDNGWYIIKEE